LDPIKRREKKEGSEKGEREAAWISLVGSFSPSVCVCVCVSGTRRRRRCELRQKGKRRRRRGERECDQYVGKTETRVV
jgi:hypothetical protein